MPRFGSGMAARECCPKACSLLITAMARQQRCGRPLWKIELQKIGFPFTVCHLL
jgi:hypothetical protein